MYLCKNYKMLPNANFADIIITFLAREFSIIEKYEVSAL